jgi:hypothetical protein
MPDESVGQVIPLLEFLLLLVGSPITVLINAYSSIHIEVGSRVVKL